MPLPIPGDPVHFPVLDPTRLLATTAMVAASLVLGGCSMLTPSLPPTTDSTSGAEIEQQSADVFRLAVGQCLNDGDASGEVSDVPSVDCSTEHDSEVYFTFDLPEGDFPGSAAVNDAAEAGCLPPFEAYVGIDYDSSSFVYTAYTPTQESWGSGDRQVVCIVYNADESKLTGSVKGAAR
ncbi:septum formation family protein [Herbiconiux liangxiaofengii]|uniref:septum formation family protein n=1 Tax=Herbiconiux liangxiaofengii TaxID=3342795 RepID=UPI0035B787D9